MGTYNQGGWRAFSRAKQVDMDTPQAVAFKSAFEGDFKLPEAVNQQDNSDEKTGRLGTTDNDNPHFIYNNTHNKRVKPDDLALILGCVMGGAITTSTPAGQTLARRHYFQLMLKTDLALPVITMVENDNRQQWQYPGIAFKSVSIKGDRGGFLSLESEFMGRGSRSVNVEAEPTFTPDEAYLRFGDCSFSRDGTLSGTVAAGTLAISGQTDISPTIRNMSYKLDNGAVGEYLPGQANPSVVHEFRRAKQFLHELTLQVEADDSTYYDLLVANSVHVASIPITGKLIESGANFKVVLWFPRVRVKKVERGSDEGITVDNITFGVEEDDTYGEVIAEVWNKIPAYLA